MDDDILREAIEAAVIQVAINNKMVDAIASASVVSDRVLAQAAKFCGCKGAQRGILSKSGICSDGTTIAPSVPWELIIE